MKNNVNKILVLFFVTLAIGFPQDNYSLSFDGAGDYIELAPSSNLAASNNELTVESWIKVSSSNNNAHSSIFGARLGYGYVLYAGSNDINVPGAANFVIFTSDNSWNELQGNTEFDIILSVVVADEGTVQISKFREFNAIGALNEKVQLPDCSGKFETTTGIYTDIIQAGTSVLDTTWSLIDSTNLILKLDDYKELIAN